jgi:hypothetical protein
MHETGIVEPMLQPIMKGIEEVLALAGVKEKVEIRYYGNSTYDTGQGLNAHIEQAMRPSRVVDSGLLIQSLTKQTRYFPKHKAHHKVIVLRSSISNSYWPNEVAHGCAVLDKVVVISTGQFTNLPVEVFTEFEKTLTEHEMGHLYGLIPKERTTNVETNCGKHCTNQCVMRSESTLLQDTVMRLQHGRTFCPECITFLRKNLR